MLCDTTMSYSICSYSWERGVMDLQHQDDKGKSMNKASKGAIYQAITTATTAGMTLFVCIGLGVLLGYWGNELFPELGTIGVFMGGLVGAVFGFYCIIRQLV